MTKRKSTFKKCVFKGNKFTKTVDKSVQKSNMEVSSETSTSSTKKSSLFCKLSPCVDKYSDFSISNDNNNVNIIVNLEILSNAIMKAVQCKNCQADSSVYLDEEVSARRGLA